jgi:hypothetical protein
VVWGRRRPLTATRPPIEPCSGRGLAGRCVSTPLVRSYPTISPFPTLGWPVRLCAILRRVACLGVIPRPALRSSGFPQPLSGYRGRSAHSASVVP